MLGCSVYFVGKGEVIIFLCFPFCIVSITISLNYFFLCCVQSINTIQYIFNFRYCAFHLWQFNIGLFLDILFFSLYAYFYVLLAIHYFFFFRSTLYHLRKFKIYLQKYRATAKWCKDISFQKSQVGRLKKSINKY